MPFLWISRRAFTEPVDLWTAPLRGVPAWALRAPPVDKPGQPFRLPHLANRSAAAHKPHRLLRRMRYKTGPRTLGCTSGALVASWRAWRVGCKGRWRGLMRGCPAAQAAALPALVARLPVRPGPGWRRARALVGNQLSWLAGRWNGHVSNLGKPHRGASGRGQSS